MTSSKPLPLPRAATQGVFAAATAALGTSTEADREGWQGVFLFR